jgi:hypothetical protein
MTGNAIEAKASETEAVTDAPKGMLFGAGLLKVYMTRAERTKVYRIQTQSSSKLCSRAHIPLIKVQELKAGSRFRKFGRDSVRNRERSPRTNVGYFPVVAKWTAKVNRSVRVSRNFMQFLLATEHTFPKKLYIIKSQSLAQIDLRLPDVVTEFK